MRPSEERQSVLGLPPLLALARERGLDGEALLGEAGIASKVLEDPLATVPIGRVHALVARLLERTGDAALGLDAGHHYHLATFGLLGAVAAVTPTAREVVRLFVEHAHLTFTPFLLELDESDASGRLVLIDHADLGALHRFYVDRDLAFVYTTVKQFWPDSYRGVLAGMELDYEEPAEAPRYHALFPCPVRFSSAQAAVVADFTADKPRADANPLGLRLLLDHLNSFGGLAGGDGDNLVERVRREVTLSVARRHRLPQLDAVARTLGVSERALRRRLSAQETSFRELVDDVLARFARRYLRDSALTLGDVAERLGYSEPAAFVRAFRRWTGTTPDAFRTGV